MPIERVGHVVIKMRDLDAAKGFYRDILGLDHLVGHPENLVATSKSAEAHGITKPLRNQAFV